MKWYIFITFFVFGNVQNSVAMQLQNSSQESLVQKRFQGHELTALAILAHSLEKKNSLNFITQKQIIAIFNYDKQKVITYLDDENHCEFSYAKFSEILRGIRQPGELKEAQDLILGKSESEILQKAYVDSCVCCIS